MRLAGGQDIITQPQWDSNLIAAATTSAVYFTTPLGQGATVWGAAGPKTLTDTNMNLAGQLPAGWAFRAYTVQFQVEAGCTIADMVLLLNSGVLSFLVGAKSFLDLPLVFAPAGGGAVVVFDAASAGTANNAVNGQQNAKNVFTLGLQNPIELTSNENFAITVNWTASLAGLAASRRTRIMLGGVLTRGIQ